MLKTFRYRKADGEESDRAVFVITEPTELLKTIDLSHIKDEKELLYIVDELASAKKHLLDTSTKLLLNDRYRNFRPDRIIKE